MRSHRLLSVVGVVLLAMGVSAGCSSDKAADSATSDQREASGDQSSSGDGSSGGEATVEADDPEGGEGSSSAGSDGSASKGSGSEGAGNGDDGAGDSGSGSGGGGPDGPALSPSEFCEQVTEVTARLADPNTSSEQFTDTVDRIAAVAPPEVAAEVAIWADVMKQLVDDDSVDMDELYNRPDVANAFTVLEQYDTDVCGNG